nr:hypothetical protein BCU37_20000 [Vibrio splendidus]PMK03973.1 hypothetical protein BCU10_23390 [Vibrio splendidus]PMK52652.1 hypothetical protein BCT96_23510 [Vibrio splendidus]
MLSPLLPRLSVNTQDIYDCLESAKLDSRSVGEQNVLLELQIYLLKIDVLIATSSPVDLNPKILRKLIGLSKQIESLLDMRTMSAQKRLSEAHEQVKKLSADVRYRIYQCIA